MNTNQVFFILVEPVYRGNVGAVARVINNFGFDKLRIVGSIPSKEDFYIAVHSEAILKNAHTFTTLAEAIADMDLVIAVSRRQGRKKSVDFLVNQLDSYTEYLPRGNIAFVFGRETYGLTDAEADLCPIRCIIPTNPAFPSLNLAQAVAIVAYNLYGVQVNQTVPLADKSEVLRTCKNIVNYLKEIEYFKDGDPANVEKQLQNLLLKSYSTQTNLRFLEKMFHRIAVLSKFGSNQVENG